MATTSYQPLRRPWAVGIANYLNLQTLPLHAQQVVVTAATYELLYQYGAPFISKWFVRKEYENFPPKTKVKWDSCVISLIQSVFITTSAIKVLATDPSRINAGLDQRLWGYSSQAGSVQAFAAGYFLWDILFSARNTSAMGLASIVHASAAFLVSMIGFRPFANYYGINLVLYELSTPFVNIHWFLDKLGKTGSNLQLYNGIGLISSFFCCRLVWGTYQTWLLSKDLYTSWQNHTSGPFPTWLFAAYFVGNATLTGLNFFWFSKMITALQNRFEKKPKDR